MSSVVRGNVKKLLNKATESCLLAVDVYNKPRTSFRSGAFIVLMNIAWTSLFHAIFYRDKTNFFYKDPNNPRLYVKIDGDRKAWELGTCIDEYFKDKDRGYEPIRSNLRFFIPLRNKIEHTFMPELDGKIFPECQALLHNFEFILKEEFGEKYVINESLVFSLQFAMWHPQSDGVLKPTSADFVKIEQYVDKYRAELPDEVSSNQRYSFRVFLVPKLTNNKNKADFAMTWIDYDSSNPSEMEQYKHVFGILSEKEASIANKGLLKPSEVSERVQEKLSENYCMKIKFDHSNNHHKCCMYYEVRPKRGEPDKANTKRNFCKYDALHDDYSYTEEWVNFLINKLSDKNEFLKVFPNQKKLILGLLTSTEVSKKVKKALNRIYNSNIKFGVSNHLKCSLYYNIRPDWDSDQEQTNEDYCIYDNGGYLYTTDWVDFLVDKLSNESEFLAIFPNQANLIS